MNRATALGVLAILVLATAAALLGPWPLLLAMTLGALPLLRTGRVGYAAFVATTLAINVLLLALLLPAPRALDLGPVALGLDGAWRGFTGGLRLTAALGANLALLGLVGAPRLLDGLRLPAPVTALLAAVVLSAHDVAADFQRLRTARRLEGHWPERRLARAREAARLLPLLVFHAHRRAAQRRDALRLVGHPTPSWFVPVVAVAALAAAGRMAFLALPNVALTYVVVFLGGLLFGPLVGMAGAALGMALTDFLLTGLFPLGFVNVLPMMLLGLAGGLLRRVDFDGPTRSERVAGAALAASAGIAGTFLFSASSDALTWIIVTGAEPAAFLPLILAGLAFNVLPALVNGALFALSVGPTLRAFRAAAAPTPPAAAREGATASASRDDPAPAASEGPAA